MKFDSREQSNEIITTGGQSLQQGLQTTKPSQGWFRSKCYCYLFESVENFTGGEVFLTATWIFIKSEISMGSVHLLREIWASGRRQRGKKAKKVRKQVRNLNAEWWVKSLHVLVQGK